MGIRSGMNEVKMQIYDVIHTLLGPKAVALARKDGYVLGWRDRPGHPIPITTLTFICIECDREWGQDFTACHLREAPSHHALEEAFMSDVSHMCPHAGQWLKRERAIRAATTERNERQRMEQNAPETF